MVKKKDDVKKVVKKVKKWEHNNSEGIPYDGSVEVEE